MVPVLLVGLCADTLIVQGPGAKLLGNLKITWATPSVTTGLTSSAGRLKLCPELLTILTVTAEAGSPGSNCRLPTKITTLVFGSNPFNGLLLMTGNGSRTCQTASKANA